MAAVLRAAMSSVLNVATWLRMVSWIVTFMVLSGLWPAPSANLGANDTDPRPGLCGIATNRPPAARTAGRGREWGRLRLRCGLIGQESSRGDAEDTENAEPDTVSSGVDGGEFGKAFEV